MRRQIYTSNSEATLHQQVCDYLRLRYPHVLFRTDMAAGMKLSPGMAIRHKRLQSGRAWPDLFIAHVNRTGSLVVCGLFLELKREGVRIYKKDGSLVSDPHIQEQAAVLERLRERGYKAEFGVGFDQCRLIIDEYLEDATEPLLTEF